MRQKIIGRKQEQRDLGLWRDSGKPEFIAVYGRRRIGFYQCNRAFLEPMGIRPEYNAHSMWICNIMDGQQTAWRQGRTAQPSDSQYVSCAFYSW